MIFIISYLDISLINIMTIHAHKGFLEEMDEISLSFGRLITRKLMSIIFKIGDTRRLVGD